MIKGKIKLIVLFLASFGITELYAQQAITTSGGNAFGNGGSISYSVGQIVYKTEFNSVGSVAHGVQQPFEISVISGLEEVQGISLVLSAYPNPASDYLILKIENYKTENLSYQLYNILGKLVLSQNISNSETPILMEIFTNGSYILKVSNNKRVLKSIKVIKNK